MFLTLGMFISVKHYVNLRKLEHEQLSNTHMRVPEHSYQYDNAFMSSVVTYDIQSAVSVSHLKVSIKTK